MRLNFKSAVWAGIIATIVMLVVMEFLGMNPLRMLGLSLGMDGIMAHVTGAIIYLVIGIIYALIYALIFEPLFKKMPRIISGAVYGFLPFFVTIFLGVSGMKVGTMPFGVAVPCSPCGGLIQDNTPDPQNPCQPSCAPCQPCEPCSPCAAHVMKTAYHPLAAAVPCSPCGGLVPDTKPSPGVPTNPPAMPKPAAPSGWLFSLINNVIYGAVLGLFYRPKYR